MTLSTIKEFRTPRGKAASMAVRDGTSDHNSAASCLTEDEYHLSDVELGDGVALDIGAHIGGVTIALALDNPEARVIAVEALGANVEVLRENIERNAVADRVGVIHAAAAKPGQRKAKVEWNFGEGVSAEHHRFIGNAQNIPRGSSHTEDVDAVSLDRLVKMAGGSVVFMKIDCELCEYELLDSPSVRDVQEIRGEFHNGYERIVELLDTTHVVSQTSGSEAFGGFAAVLR